MGENKTKATDQDVAAFIDGVADPGRRKDARAVAEMMARVSGELPRMWGPSIVGYVAHRYRYDSGREGEMCQIGFSPRAKELVLYVLGFDGQEQMLARLGKHRTGKSCLYIKRLADVDMQVLEDLVRTSLDHVRAQPQNAGCVNDGRS